MSLKKYREKRNFRITTEPKPKEIRHKTSRASKNKLKYLIQKHDASHLHYDLRLEMAGVLKSFAVPKGPSLDPNVKHLAVETEDHPMEYGKFEGIIPQGQYGGGTVMLWDRGYYKTEIDPMSLYRKGDITFEIKGSKLKGLWKLIKMRRKEAKSGTGSKSQWLFFKLPDEYADKNYDILKKEPLSVSSKRTMEQIAEGEGKKRVWQSKKSASSAMSFKRKKIKNKLKTSKIIANKTRKNSKIKKTSSGSAKKGLKTSHKSKVTVALKKLPHLKKKL